MERLHKVLARAGVASRRAAEALIAAGRVTVNGTAVTRLGTQVDPDRDAIKVDGARVKTAPEAPLYLMLHKPRGVVTTLSDPEGRPTVRDYLRGIRGRVFPVGRLDFASEGLLLLTTDGALARDLMHPSRGVPKTYAAKVRGTPSAEALRRLAKGVVVEGRKTLPARVRLLEAGTNAWVEVTVVEGRKHQVRHMFDAVGHRVQRLRRIRYGGVELGPLPPGALRSLTPREVERLRTAARPRNPLK
jgi:23S rRNA pseudouridine2605 synthase